MKRFIPLALIVPLAVAGCSSSSKSSTSSTSNVASNPSSSTPTASDTGSTSMNLSNPTSAVTINEAGSSLLFPYLQTIAPGLHTTYPNVTLNPAAGGSGAGINDAISGTTQLGGSDAYLSPTEFNSHPGLLNVPIVVSSQAVDYNLPGVSNLKLTGDVLAQIYQGKITKWNDPAIAALNSGVALPAETIVPVHRSDSSGDTFLFSSFLSATNASWASGPGYNTSITWPNVGDAQTAQGNPGMVQTCKATPGCVAYVGISAQASAETAGLHEAQLQNKSGSYVTPTASNVEAAVTSGATSIPSNLAQSLIYESGNDAYPIVNFEYIVVKKAQPSPDAAQAIRDFLAYAVDANGGSSTADLAKNQFQALPSNVLPQVKSAIASIQ